MQNRTVTRLAGIILAAVAGAASLQVAAPSQAADEFPAACTDRVEYVTDDEVDQIFTTGHRASWIFRLFDGSGTRAEGTTRDALVRDWVGCDRDGLYLVRVKFGRTNDGWRMMWLDGR